ncbi:MAG: hypothetical protein N3G20_11920, partial [Verrucomicrobiae bacterium]|nr:hypothetical protein [Verrucomicrobiae bacterium]
MSSTTHRLDTFYQILHKNKVTRDARSARTRIIQTQKAMPVPNPSTILSNALLMTLLVYADSKQDYHKVRSPLRRTALVPDCLLYTS